MSLLDSGTEDVIIYPEIVVKDSDGNVQTKASDVGIPAKASLQIQNQSGTSSRKAEQQEEGYETERVYTMRLARSFIKKHGLIGAQGQVEWRGQRFGIFGDVMEYTRSRRTRHVIYTLRRS
ncbi:MAG: hypothetical protein ACXWOV_00170 [Isosphaeraceae bacterium]